MTNQVARRMAASPAWTGDDAARDAAGVPMAHVVAPLSLRHRATSLAGADFWRGKSVTAALQVGAGLAKTSGAQQVPFIRGRYTDAPGVQPRGIPV